MKTQAGNMAEMIYQAGYLSGLRGENFASAYAQQVSDPERFGEMFAYGYGKGYEAS